MKSDPPGQPDRTGLVLGFVGMLCFAGTLPATRLAIPYLDPLFLTFARAALAGIVAAGLLIVLRRPVPARSHWREIAIISAALVYGFPLFSALAVQSVPVSHGGVVLGILPLATAAAAAVVARERPSLGFWVAAALGTAIVVAFAVRHGRDAGAVIGDLWLLAAIAAGGLGYAYGGKLSTTLPGWEVIAWALVISLPLAVLATAISWPSNAASIPMPAWLGLAYVALISQLIGFFFWNAGLARGGIARVGQMQLLQPFVIAAMAATVNRETVGADTLLFAGAVVATVFVSSRMRVAR
jgi:drug/metabolite transporter (DMT)-like permease